MTKKYIAIHESHTSVEALGTQQEVIEIVSASFDAAEIKEHIKFYELGQQVFYVAELISKTESAV